MICWGRKKWFSLVKPVVPPAYNLSRDTQCVFCSVTIDMDVAVDSLNAQLCTSSRFGSLLPGMSDVCMECLVGAAHFLFTESFALA
jgi:hypothetical protein